jgi:hypothetical protein
MGALTAVQRRASATIPPAKGHPSGRFPMPDAKHARLALAFLPRAKGLTPAQAARIRARAKRKLGRRRG